MSLILANCISLAQKGVVIVPVADLLGNQGGEQAYQQLALCTKPVTACKRVHQILFNEIVTIQEEKDAEIKIQISSAYYELSPQGVPQITYWTLKKNILPLSELSKSQISLQTIPDPVKFTSNKVKLSAQSIISLIYPHYDPITNMTYSAGTRFVATSNQGSSNVIEVFALDINKKAVAQIQLPSKKCIKLSPSLSWHERKEIFLKLLRSWTRIKKGYIPYVWGGCSFIGIEKEPHFLSVQGQNGCTLFQPLSHKSLCSGLDCAGLIVRAAQIVGIPYYLKNTATIANHLTEITSAHEIEAGDLIWFPGHVIVISDAHKHSIIEARAYSQGYGKVHELALSNVFKDIHHFDQLLAAAQQKKTIYRLQKDGKIAHAISNLKILKLSSILHK
jgi:hypothetical protein